MTFENIMLVLRLLLPVAAQVASIFHGAAQAKTAAQTAVDTDAKP